MVWSSHGFLPSHPPLHKEYFHLYIHSQMEIPGRLHFTIFIRKIGKEGSRVTKFSSLTLLAITLETLPPQLLSHPTLLIFFLYCGSWSPIWSDFSGSFSPANKCSSTRLSPNPLLKHVDSSLKISWTTITLVYS